MDLEGQLLNTNADTIAAELAIQLAIHFRTKLTYIIREPGVLEDINNPSSLISRLDETRLEKLNQNRNVSGGMLPKLNNGFRARQNGVNLVQITNYNQLADPTSGTILF
jgi:acetylglutamate kinase